MWSKHMGGTLHHNLRKQFKALSKKGAACRNTHMDR